MNTGNLHVGTDTNNEGEENVKNLHSFFIDRTVLYYFIVICGSHYLNITASIAPGTKKGIFQEKFDKLFNYCEGDNIFFYLRW